MIIFKREENTYTKTWNYDTQNQLNDQKPELKQNSFYTQWQHESDREVGN